MSRRAKPPVRPVRITLDGERILADDGEPAAAALLAAGKLAIARSTKFHRPRGPSCMRGACDGCLARVDDEPNIMTCMVPAHDGMAIETQNTLGSRNLDLLRMTDWFFPQGMNHHELFAGIPGAQGVMQAFARRVAGLGRLPGEVTQARGAKRRTLDVAVVGAGPSGMAVAAALAEQGRAVEMVDDALVVGGGLRALGGADRDRWKDVLVAFENCVAGRRVRVRSRTVAGGVFGDDFVLVGPEGAEVCTASDLVLAPGAHDGVGLFEGNDVPGVLSARAAGILTELGVVLGKRVVILRPPGEETAGFGEAFARSARAIGRGAPDASGLGAADVVVVPAVVRVVGSSRVRAVVVQEGSRQREIKADALVVDLPSAPAYELAEQAGARLEHRARGFVVKTEEGRIRDHVWAVGEVTGTPFSPARIVDESRRVAAAIQSSINAPNRASPPAMDTRSNVPSRTR